MKADVDRLCRDLGYHFHAPRLIEQALTHRSAGGGNNERLEYLGDAILGFVIADALYQHFKQATEGQLSRLRAHLVKRDTLAGIAREFKLGDYLNLGQGELRSGGQSRDSILADSVEAILAAIYLDGGYPASREVILRIFTRHLRGLSLEGHQKDPKTQLQEYLQAKRIGLPGYEIMDVSGDPHDQVFSMFCEIPELEQRTIGRGTSRRKAEQDAASQMLMVLKHE
ncbi:MAG: ribonuclease III [Candidatus Thiodiazotropha sp. (ex Epidulcina cf. delphinae)]|nr:ribonuclease III [Candidatus Thiodiazotropha sp. (ex Epidulcina cf. delphinae)]